jgi:aspartate/methionine/tyrosine aminotransferase
MSQLYAKNILKIDTENAFKVGPYIGQVEAGGAKVIRCNLGEPDFDLPNYIRDELKIQIDKSNTHYCDPQGVISLRTAIADKMREDRGLKNVTADHVVVFPGGKPPIWMSQMAYIEAGDEVIYPSPGFPIYESVIPVEGGVPVPLHLREENDFSFTGEELAELITPRTKMIFLNFPSNPTGGVATREQLEGIAKVIKEKCDENVRVYSDEIYEYIVFDGLKNQSIASIEGMQERTIIVSGTSKTFSWTGGRMGWAVFPTVQEAQMFKNLNINLFSCVPPYNQEAAAVALTGADREKEVGKMVSTFQERRDQVVNGLNKIDGVSCVKPSGAFYVFPNIGGVCQRVGAIDAYNKLPKDVQQKTSPSTLFQMFLLFTHHVAAMDRKSFGRIDTDGMHFLRLSIATDMDSLKTAVKKIGEAADDRQGFAAFMQGDYPLF